jgi:hypothetical protein
MDRNLSGYVNKWLSMELMLRLVTTNMRHSGETDEHVRVSARTSAISTKYSTRVWIGANRWLSRLVRVTMAGVHCRDLRSHAGWSELEWPFWRVLLDLESIPTSALVQASESEGTTFLAGPF